MNDPELLKQIIERRFIHSIEKFNGDDILEQVF